MKSSEGILNSVRASLKKNSCEISLDCFIIVVFISLTFFLETRLTCQSLLVIITYGLP